MQKITFTTVVKNPATLPLLFEMTDKLVSAGLLHSLRVIDKTEDHKRTTRLRSLLPMDGDTGSRIVLVDFDVLRVKDPCARVMSGMTGYRHKTTDVFLVPGGPSVTVAARGPEGSYIGVFSRDRVTGGFELALKKDSCFLRRGKGGGAVLDKVDVPGVVAGGCAWRSAEISWKEDGKLEVKIDTGDVLKVDMPKEIGELSLTVSASPVGLSDIVVTSLGSFDMCDVEVDRSYASYFLSTPPEVDGLEVRCSSDVVMIDVEGWASIIEGGVPVVIGDATSLGALRRLGIISKSESSADVHRSFLSKSKASIQKIKFARDSAVETLYDKSKSSVLINRSSELGPPVLFSVLNEEVVFDSSIIEEYSNLVYEGLVGPEEQNYDNVLMHIDRFVADEESAKRFLLEIVEAIPVGYRRYLLDTLKNVIQ